MACAASLGLALRSYAEAEPCGPFEATSAPFQIANAEPGVAPAQSSGGVITTLAEPAAIPIEPPRGEALLALPKDASGALPTGIGLAPGARIAASYWSPILCATVARVVGPANLTPDELVPQRPAGVAVVANQVYATAQSEIRPLPPPAGADPYRPLQYGLDQLGIDAARGAGVGSGVRVALLDSSPASDHRDLGAIEILPLEDGPSTQPASHGTLVAGVVRAISHNNFGIEGVAPGVSLLAVPVCTPQGASASDRCLLYDLLRGVDRAYEREARVMNLSLVGPDNPLLARAMTRLDELGVLIVAAAGNEGTSEPRYPAAYPSVIGVGALDRERRVYARSNRGLSAEIYAPGVEVISTVPADSFAFGTGTSFAASQVSGALALLIGAGASPADARAALFRQASQESEGSEVVRMPALCDVLARLGKPCTTP